MIRGVHIGAISTTKPAVVAELPSAFVPQEPTTPFRETEAAKWLWMARAVIVCAAGGLAWYTWGHWGDFQIDNGRELYVPAAILQGKLLFRDVWYMYGPLAAYVNALLFWIFGVQLTVLYVFGCVLTISTALLTFGVARRFQLGLLASTVPALCFLVEAFYPFIRNFVFPYSYAASLGAFLGLACLYFVVLHASSPRRWYLAAASLLSGLAVLTKQEFGFACMAILGCEIVGSYLRQRSGRDLFRDIAVCAAGHLPAVAGYGWFVWKVSARVLFIENWVSTPGTYFMRHFSQITLPQQGFRFGPSELLEAGELTALSIALWALIACVIANGIKRWRIKSRLPMAAFILIGASPLWLAAIAFTRIFPEGYARHPTLVQSLTLVPLTQASFPKGIFFLVILFTIHALWKFLKSPSDGLALQEVGLGVYAGLVAVRQMMELRPSLYLCSVFFNVPAFLIFIILLHRIFRWALRALDGQSANFVAGGLFVTEVVLLCILFFPKPQILPALLTTDHGSFYTRPDVATLFPQIISFMKTHTRNGKDILVWPEPPSLYVFAGMQSPTKWYSLLPGCVPPEQEQGVIDELVANQVRYVLIANRIVVEYGVQGFANGGYDPAIYHWVMANYQKVGQFGPLPDQVFPPYTVWIYEKKEPQPAD